MVASYIYLIHDTKYIKQNIYKIGRTTQNGDCRKIGRLQCYSKYSNIELLRQVDTELVIKCETEIITAFNNQFELIDGNEWFKGDKYLMIKTINSIMDNYITTKKEEIIKNTMNENENKENSEFDIYVLKNLHSIDIPEFISIFNKLFGNNFITKHNNTIYCYNSKYWETDDILFRQYISNQLYDYLSGLIYNNRATINNYLKIKSRLDKLKTYSYKTELLKTYKEYGVNEEINFDSKWNLLGFNNMIYDMETGELREYKYDDYVSITTRYDWREPTIEEMHTMTSLIEQVMPIEAELEAYLQILSTALSGKCLEKFIIFNGSGGNGKGMINDILLLALGDYAMIGNNAVLFEQAKTGSNPEKANLHKKRLVIFREPPEKNRFENSVIKELTGGGSISARGLYESTCAKELNLTLIVECNKRPLFKEEPTDADARRIVDLLFRSSFVSNDELLDDDKYIYKANTDYKTKGFQDQHKFALLKILMITYQKYKYANCNLVLPPSVIERSARYLELSCNIVQWFRDNYEEGLPTEFVSVRDAYELFITSDFISGLARTERAKYTKKYFVEYIQNNIFFRKYYADRYNTIRTVIKGWKRSQQID